MPKYLDTTAYRAAIDAIATAPADDLSLDLRSRITIILGEMLDIWPDSICDDCERLPVVAA